MGRYNVDDFEKWDGERVVYELDSLSGGKPFVRRLFFKNDDELEMYLQGDRGYYFFPSEEIAEKFFDEFIDNADRELGIPTRKEVKDFANSNNNFKKWFGNSVVVNSDGSPKIVYHGTGREFEEFMDCGYIFLASSPSLACDYAYAFYDSLFTSIPIRTQRKFKRHINNKIDLFNEKLPKHIELKKFYDYRDGQWVKYLVNKETRKSLKVDDWTSEKSIKNFINSSKSKGGVYPLYCRIENPYKMDAKGRSWEDIDGRGHIAEDFINIAKDNGCDGLIIDNVVDGSGYKETQYIPFSPNQVKHVYNIGTYSNNTNNFWENKSMKKQLIRLTESDLHKIIKESVKKIIKEYEEDPYSLDADEIYGDRAEREYRQSVRDKMFQDDWEMRNRRLRQKYPGKSEEWYEAMIDTFYESKKASKTIEEENGGGATSCANVMQTGSGKLGTNPEAGQYTVPFGADKETADRTTGKISMGGRAKWNVNNGNVQRRDIYNPKSGKK